jgi:MoaA/NifB/PqqE/SkfB family radical SAM enzyme
MQTLREHPLVPLQDLDELWFQITGTLCNLHCTHCFISCSPTNETHGMIPKERALAMLEVAKEKGVKEYYFTGGEPFLHKDLFELIEATLKQGPLTILTNGTLISENRAKRLAEIAQNSEYNLDLRISIDGLTPEENDEIRGAGAFQKIITSVERLYRNGITPIITVTEVREGMGSAEGRKKFIELLYSFGIKQPRLKFLSPFKIGKEAERTSGYENYEYVYEDSLIEGEKEMFQCSNSRMITDDGIYPCPILINASDAKMGNTLDEVDKPIQLKWSACYTCHVSGVSCRN